MVQRCASRSVILYRERQQTNIQISQNNEKRGHINQQDINRYFIQFYLCFILLLAGAPVPRKKTEVQRQ
jgi:hypothetical protein